MRDGIVEDLETDDPINRCRQSVQATCAPLEATSIVMCDIPTYLPDIQTDRQAQANDKQIDKTYGFPIVISITYFSAGYSSVSSPLLCV